MAQSVPLKSERQILPEAKRTIHPFTSVLNNCRPMQTDQDDYSQAESIGVSSKESGNAEPSYHLIFNIENPVILVGSFVKIAEDIRR
jgi:hypothetical protein